MDDILIKSLSDSVAQMATCSEIKEKTRKFMWFSIGKTKLCKGLLQLIKNQYDNRVFELRCVRCGAVAMQWCNEDITSSINISEMNRVLQDNWLMENVYK